jgi:hypothetical protein
MTDATPQEHVEILPRAKLCSRDRGGQEWEAARTLLRHPPRLDHCSISIEVRGAAQIFRRVFASERKAGAIEEHFPDDSRTKKNDQNRDLQHDAYQR